MSIFVDKKPFTSYTPSMEQEVLCMYFSRSRRAFCIFLSTLMVVSTFPLSALRADDTEIKYYSVEGSNKFEVEQVTTSTWEGHANIELKIRNTGDEIIDNWYITFETPYIIENIWNATIIETDNNGTYTIRNNYYNQDIGIDSEVTIGVTISLCDAELGNFSDWYFLNTKTYEVESDKYYISYQEYSKWDDGFNGALVLNSIDYIEDWSLSFDSEYEITTISNAVIESTEGGTYTITNDGSSQNISSNMLLLSIQGIPTENDFAIGNVIMSSVGMAYGLSDDEDNNGIADYLDFIYSIEDIDPITPTPTDEPTVTSVPTITADPTNNPTVTSEPTATTNPTPTEEIDLEKDSDEDGLPDRLEIELGTNIEEADSDSDNLSDFVEYIISYDPTDPDTDKDDIPDGDEDYDEDRITNVQEIELGTELYVEDSDFDLLKDGDELEIYGTDPTNYDTDGDLISDGDEVYLGKNPSDISDGNVKIEQQIAETISNEKDGFIFRVDIKASFSNRIENIVEIENLYEQDVYLSDLRGRKGCPVGFNSNEDFEIAEVVFFYDESLLGETDENNLIILWYNEETGMFVEQEQAVLDIQDNTITVELEHFSKYIIVDGEIWYAPFDLPPFKQEKEEVYYDYYFFFDCSSSMSASDRMRELSVFERFIRNIREDDRIIVSFFDSQSCYLGIDHAVSITNQSDFNDMNDLVSLYLQQLILPQQYSEYYRAFVGFNGIMNTGLIDDVGNNKHIFIFSGNNDNDAMNVINTGGITETKLYQSSWVISEYDSTVTIVPIIDFGQGVNNLFNPGWIYSEYLDADYCEYKDLMNLWSRFYLKFGFTRAIPDDFDGDGIPDNLEKLGLVCIGSDKKKFTKYTTEDIDNDGVPDGYDTDKDGLSDGEEVGSLVELYMNDKHQIDVRINGVSRAVFDNATLTGEFKCLQPYIPTQEDDSTYVFSFYSDPVKNDTDEDTYFDSIDFTPNEKSIITVGLKGEEFEFKTYSQSFKDQSYISVTKDGKNYYGGNQGWFENIQVSSWDHKLYILSKDAGCGVIALTDTDLYLTYGSYKIDYDNYEKYFFSNCSQLLNYLEPTGTVYTPIVACAPVLPINIKLTMNEFGHGSYLSDIGSDTTSVKAVINSLKNDKPVILSVFYISEEIKEQVHQKFEGVSIYEYLSSEVGGGYKNPPKESQKIAGHYDTITGVIIDKQTNEIWVRVQSWGDEYYYSYNELVDFRNEHKFGPSTTSLIFVN